MECPECDSYLHEQARECPCGWKAVPAAALSTSSTARLEVTFQLELEQKFKTLDKDFQELITAAAEDKIHWRGESKEVFIGIIDNTEELRRIGPREWLAKHARRKVVKN